MSTDNQIHHLSRLSLEPGTSHNIPGGSNASSIWQAAIDRYYDELSKGQSPYN
ncbi:hypothetical protein BDV41DRAFT_545903 [Aspergillus transmontanensis]|uniref:Uncharacterized protein n=1 Tax=Aspergillus transmontanensis TaxID=1034304 RepID=A0A5N6VNX7_9EURO|nr:hypothetical protein BDV41DRAFT_545903 [Aspergillus transmontanensis]